MPTSVVESRWPIIRSTSPEIRYGKPFLVTGEQFGGQSEASGGGTRNSAVNYPLVHLRALDGGQHRWLVPDPLPNFRDDPMTLSFSDLPPTIHPGYYVVTVVTAGVPSESVFVEAACSIAITTNPASQIVAIGESATFPVESQGALHFQWQKNGIDIPGATEATYTTPPVTAADSGTTYHVVAGNGCTTAVSALAKLTIADQVPPDVTLLDPSGGEFWLLSEPDAPNVEKITWEMSDNVRICQAELALFYSNDGTTWFEAPPGGGLPATLGSTDACTHPGLETTSHDYTLPTEPPSGSVHSQYKVRLRVVDQAGNATEVESARPFTIQKVNPTAVKTLILSNVPRMEAVMGITPAEAADVEAKLSDLAAHPDVQGLVVDLSAGTLLANLYAAWDADRGDPSKANAVLFGAGGVHERLREAAAAFPGTRYVIVVGDDRIVPMARVRDRTLKLPEQSYTDGIDLTADGTTVGEAIAANRYLSDDLLAVLEPVLPADVDAATHVPDLALGRLVETPREIVQAITVFLNHNGILDLTDPASVHKVLVTGYDFLTDVGKRNRGTWKDFFGVPHVDTDLAPVDGVLVSATWDLPGVPERRDALKTHLGGHGVERYGVVNLNGHATHHQEGVPGTDRFDIRGLPTTEILDLDLAGSVIYAVGCHGGLPVAGSDPFDADHSLDLPQTMLARGVQAYMANTGYGWGLIGGVGYSERLVEILTGRLAVGGTVVMGDAFVRTKQEYFLSTFRRGNDDPDRLKPYAEKTVQQWAFFGFPMYAVHAPASAAASPLFAGPAPTGVGRSMEESLGAATVTRQQSTDRPPYLTRLDFRFDLSAPGVYRKYTAGGDVLPGDPNDPLDPPAPGCPAAAEGEPEGCYYTLNGLSTDDADLPVEPALVYDSRLAGTSQHGVLWMGGSYREESGWTPAFAELASNQQEPLDDHGSTPDTVLPRPRGETGDNGGTGDCSAVDLELASIVLATGETVKNPATALFDVERLYRTLDLEVFYFNNTLDGAGNCDRTGPEILPGPFGGKYHRTVGLSVEWAVEAADAAGVWRVVVVYNDYSLDGDNVGTWVPLELDLDGVSGQWRGAAAFPEGSRVTYMVQAVDLRGNVRWLEFVTAALPLSGVAPSVPATFDASLTAEPADLGVALADDPDPVTAGDVFRYDVEVGNLGPGLAAAPEVVLTLPPGTTYRAAGHEVGWSCSHAAGVVICSRDTLAVGSSSISVFVEAPDTGGAISATVTVTSANDPDPSNDMDTEETFVMGATMTDLAILKEDGGVPVTPGEVITYSITVSNLGPNPVYGATVTDDFPPELLNVVWECLATAGSSCGPSGAGDISDIVDLLPDGTVLYLATAIVAPGTLGTIENVATVGLGTSAVTDPFPGNNGSSVRTEVTMFYDGFESGDASRWSSSR